MAQQAPAAPLTLPRPAPAPVASAQGMRGRGLRITGTPYARRIAAITAGGAVLRVTLLGHQPLWRDEAFTELASRRSWSGMLEAVRHDSAPPLSYVLTHLST